MREMGQSAWLSTSSLTLQGSEGRVNARETGKGCKDWILWGNIYSVWPVIGKGETNLGGKNRARFVPFLAVISLQDCYR